VIVVVPVDPCFKGIPLGAGGYIQEKPMFFLLLGIAALALKYLEIGPVATLNWFIVLSPFAMAVAWWAWADASGYTKRREIDKMAKRKDDRIDKQREAMGMLSAKKRKK
jgi:small Trp-rich protein